MTAATAEQTDPNEGATPMNTTNPTGITSPNESPQHPLAIHTDGRSSRLRLDVWATDSPEAGEFVAWVHPADEWVSPLDYSGWEAPIMPDLAAGCRVEIKREGGRTVPVSWDLWLTGDKELPGRSTLGGTVCDLLPDMIRFRTGMDHWDAPIPVTVAVRAPSDAPRSRTPIVFPPVGH